MRTTNPPPGTPTRPALKPTRRDFADALQHLRKSSGLTLKQLETSHRLLKKSTISEDERGTRWPPWERVHAYLTVCLTHQQLTDLHIQAELTHWRTAWTHAHHHTSHPQPPQAPPHTDSTQQPPPTGDAEPEAGNKEAVEDSTALCALRPDPVEARPKHPPVMTIGGDSDPTMRTVSTDTTNTRGELHQGAAAPREQPHPPHAAPAHHHRRWALSTAAAAGAAAAAVAAGAVIATTTGILKSPTSTRPISPPPTTAAPPLVQTTVMSPTNAAAPPPAQAPADPPLPAPREIQPAQKSPINPPRQTSPSRVPSPATRAPSNNDHNANITGSYNYDNHGVDNTGGTITNSTVAGGDINNSGNTQHNQYNR